MPGFKYIFILERDLEILWTNLPHFVVKALRPREQNDLPKVPQPVARLESRTPILWAGFVFPAGLPASEVKATMF